MTPAPTRPTDRAETPIVGEIVEGIERAVVNERAARASAGLLFLFGFVAWLYALSSGDLTPLRAFGAAFLLEMNIRLFVSSRFAPVLALGALVTRRQRPEWVDARSKQFAWALGLGMALVSCLSLGLLGLPAAITLVICALCMTLLFAETAFGLCIGCSIARRVLKDKPELCGGDSCRYTPPARGDRHRVDPAAAGILTPITTERS
mgnify:FL=1